MQLLRSGKFTAGDTAMSGIRGKDAVGTASLF